MSFLIMVKWFASCKIKLLFLSANCEGLVVIKKNHLILEFFNFFFWQKLFRQFKKKKNKKKRVVMPMQVSLWCKEAKI
jgi:hypothetical protein